MMSGKVKKRLLVATIVGARPQFIKASVLSRIIRSRDNSNKIEEYLIHTGQHYDGNMSDIFFSELGIPNPDINLQVGSQSHGRQTGEMLIRIEETLGRIKPDVVLVYGDTNSTLAGALAGCKMDLEIAHVEAGLRSYDKSMPEEINRIVADHVSTMLFCPTQEATENLQREGIVNSEHNRPIHVWNVGDIMLDASLFYRKRAIGRPDSERIIKRFDLEHEYVVVTIHRAENTDNPSRLQAIVEALNALSSRPIVFPMHPRTRKIFGQNEFRLSPHVRVIDPVGYLDMIELEAGCSLIITDSGGVQKEAYFFKKPCVTLRDSTEWKETVYLGKNVLVGADTDRIIAAVSAKTDSGNWSQLYGDGKAGQKIVAHILEHAKADVSTEK